MRLTLPNLAVGGGVLLIAFVAAFALSDVWSEAARSVSGWAVARQRVLRDDMATAVRAVQSGAPWAWAALMAAAGTYGLVHAVGPGHGKFVIGGVGLGSSVSAPRLASIALASSLAQSAWAIALVYGGFTLLEASAARLASLSEGYLAAASSVAIACVGALLAFRGVRAFWRRAAHRKVGHGAHGHRHDHGRDHGRDHSHEACGCGGHGPSPKEVAAVSSLREAAALVAGIAVRPCTGALFLLVIAWRMDIAAAGAAAVIVMGLGTALTTSAVAISSVAARGLALSASGTLGIASAAAPSLQLAAGLAIVWFAYALFQTGAF
ncbi:MAG: hypothetical protein AAFN79_17660 [Pseudomonadota bacterium]